MNGKRSERPVATALHTGHRMPNMGKGIPSSLVPYRTIVEETLALANKWHDQISHGFVPTSREAAEFRDKMASLHCAAQAAWHRYCENDRDFEIPE